uniref:Uncharacterized protein n=1 Tax=Ciona intestinalis TaxID=7719 RepID=H2Y3K8_CIOIN
SFKNIKTNNCQNIPFTLIIHLTATAYTNVYFVCFFTSDQNPPYSPIVVVFIISMFLIISVMSFKCIFHKHNS